jgi:predicted dehydrogenase
MNPIRMMPAMSRVRTAIVGLGYWGPNLLRNFAAQEECDMVWACDLSEKNLAKTRAHYPSVKTTEKYEDVLGDETVDLILIATPTSAHFPLAKAALEAGKHVFIEKPMTATVAEADALVALAEQHGKQIFVDHTFVFASAVEKLKDLALSGKLGDLLYFDSSRINLGLIQKDTNVLYDLAIHDLSILGTFLDLNKITKVTAHGSKHFGQQEEHVHLHLETDGDFHAHIQVSWLSPVKIRQTVLAGTKAMVIYDDTHPSEKIRVYDRGIEHDDTKPDPFFPKYRSGDIVIPSVPLIEALGVEAKHVLQCVLGNEKPRVSGENGRQILRILDAADRSMKTKTTVTL